MTKIFKALCGTALALSLVSPAIAQKADKNAPAPAAASTAAVVPGIGVANLNAAVAASNAFQVAGQQRQTTYKATYDAAQARATQIETELKGLVEKFNADKAAKKPDAILQQSYVAVQQRQELLQVAKRQFHDTHARVGRPLQQPPPRRSHLAALVERGITAMNGTSSSAAK